MRSSILVLILTTLSWTAFTPPNDNTMPVDACQIDNVSFQSGEKLVYKIYYNWNFIWASAGEVVFEVEDTGDEYHLTAFGYTYKSYDWFYRVRDRYDTYVNKETLLPRLSTKTIEEGSDRLYDKTTFNQQARRAKTIRGKTKATAENKFTFDLDNCMHDMLSMMYHARNIDYDSYKPQQQFPATIFMDKTVYPLQVKYYGKEVKKVKGKGKYNTILFSPEVVEGTIFKEGNQMRVWISDDDNKIPVLIESPLSVGSVKVVLKSYEGLRHAFEGVVE
ncbi:MAG: DUF3108 domain-containing protein [Bacteroidota bacterium]